MFHSNKCIFKLVKHTKRDTYIYKCEHKTSIEVDTIPNSMEKMNRWGRLKCSNISMNWRMKQIPSNNTQAKIKGEH